MKIAAVDNEGNALEILIRAIEEALPDAQVQGFRRASALLEEVQTKHFAPDIAFLDIEMPGMSGLELAKRLKDSLPNINIIFITGYKDYALDAFNLHACGYLLKPAKAQNVLEAMEYLNRPVKTSNSGKRLRIQCFGSFEVFIDGEPVAFPRQKSKELFAYLIDRRGAQCTMAEIANILWEDGVYDSSRNSQIHSYLHDLVKTLDQLGEPNVIFRKRNATAIDVTKVSCDAYDCLDGNPAAINAYTGEYMYQYSWAEFRTSALLKML